MATKRGMRGERVKLADASHLKLGGLERLAYTHWYSICSKHYHFHADCGLCMTGHWADERENWPVFRLR